MATRASCILPVLISVFYIQTNLAITEEDANLNKMATDVVEDALRVLIREAKKTEAASGKIRIGNFKDKLHIGDLDFFVDSGEGRLEGFPSMRMSGPIEFKYLEVESREENGTHTETRPDVDDVKMMLMIHVPISFKTFATLYNDFQIRNQDQIWTGHLFVDVKKTKFMLKFKVEHDAKGLCRVRLPSIDVVEYDDADIDVILDGLDIPLRNLTGADYTEYPHKMVRAAFEFILGRNRDVFGYCEYTMNQP